VRFLFLVLFVVMFAGWLVILAEAHSNPLRVIAVVFCALNLGAIITIVRDERNRCL